MAFRRLAHKSNGTTDRAFAAGTQPRAIALAWHAVCRRAEWRSPAGVKETFRSASFVKDNVVFNIAGNKYRIVVRINHVRQAMFVKFVGTHKQYDEVDVGSL